MKYTTLGALVLGAALSYGSGAKADGRSDDGSADYRAGSLSALVMEGYGERVDPSKDIYSSEDEDSGTIAKRNKYGRFKAWANKKIDAAKKKIRKEEPVLYNDLNRAYQNHKNKKNRESEDD
jgi:hypothetical protein